ncbi:serine hydrolase domain-containing protein [Pseudaestuariivita sp.]|uniref:serine hydrolase domain-containing protein n=1 Tax=Pseudaestuariivita sp. TaxID=2211669 RepID=UPI004057FBBA
MIRLAAVVTLLALPLAAEPASEAFDDWLQKHDIPNGALAVIREGDLTGYDHGWAADAPAEMSSLSKAITGLCAAELVDEGLLAWDDTPEGGTDVTLKELVLHTGGIGPDSTQGLLGSLRYMGKEPNGDVARRARERAVQAKRVGQFDYNNENYALIAEMISAVAPEGVEDACAARVLAPAGVTGGASELAGHALAWGGWHIAPLGYARLHAYWFDGARKDPRDTPLYIFEGAQVFYGLGTFVRFSSEGTRFWHFGGTCVPRFANSGAFALTQAGDWTVVAAYDACIDDAAALELSEVLFEAMQAAN